MKSRAQGMGLQKRVVECLGMFPVLVALPKRGHQFPTKTKAKVYVAQLKLWIRGGEYREITRMFTGGQGKKDEWRFAFSFFFFFCCCVDEEEEELLRDPF